MSLHALLWMNIAVFIVLLKFYTLFVLGVGVSRGASAGARGPGKARESGNGHRAMRGWPEPCRREESGHLEGRKFRIGVWSPK